MDPVTVTLVLTPTTSNGTVHVEGELRADGRSGRSFSGWMALLALLEDTVSAAATPGSAPGEVHAPR